jgi:hypothetical protein
METALVQCPRRKGGEESQSGGILTLQRQHIEGMTSVLFVQEKACISYKMTEPSKVFQKYAE